MGNKATDGQSINGHKYAPGLSAMKQICDMIKGNESDDGNIDFELQANKGHKCLRILLIFNIQELVISLQADVRLRWGLDQTVAFKWTSDRY